MRRLTVEEDWQMLFFENYNFARRCWGLEYRSCRWQAAARECDWKTRPVGSKPRVIATRPQHWRVKD